MAFEDDFGLSSGIRDDYDATITHAYFEQDTKIQGAPLYLYCNLTDTDGETETPRYGVGSGWVTHDQGASIERTADARGTKINNGSGYGKLINAITGDPGLPEAKRIIVSKYDTGGKFGIGARGTAWLIGLSFHWVIEVEKMEEWTNNAGEKVAARNRNTLLPVRFLGEGLIDTLASGQTGSGTPTGGLSDETMQKLKVAAITAASYVAWVQAVMAMPEAQAGQPEQPKIVTVLGNEEFYKGLK